jgi:CRISP-associated protein Cas1
MHTLAISEQGTSVHADGDTLVVQRGKSVLRRIRAGELEQVLLFGGVEVTRQAMNLLLRREIEMVLLTQDGRFRGRLSGRGSKNVQLRLAQYQRSTDPAFCLGVARTIVAGKLQNQRQILLRAQRRLQDDDLAVAVGNLRVMAQRAAECTDLDVLRGFEGQGAALYFGQFGKLIRIPEFQFTTRSRRPPKDPVNALLSFGYAVLGSLAESDVYRCGLDPMLGFLHQPAYGRPSLMLDLLEEFRPLIDTLVLRVVNRRQLSVQDFDQRTGQSLAEMLADQTPPDQPDGPVLLLLDDGPSAATRPSSRRRAACRSRATGLRAGRSRPGRCSARARGGRVLERHGPQDILERIVPPDARAAVLSAAGRPIGIAGHPAATDLPSGPRHRRPSGPIPTLLQQLGGMKDEGGSEELGARSQKPEPTHRRTDAPD